VESQLFKEVKVSEIRNETANAVTITLEPVDWKPSYKAGQFITLVFQTRHGEKRRSYSITGSSELGEPLEITVKKIDNGEFSRPLNYHTKPGEVFLTTGIYGMFVLPEKKNGLHYFFLAAGSGITPCYPMIKVILFQSDSKVTLIYSNRSQEEAIFYRQLGQLKEQFAERFSIRFLFSSSMQVTTRRLSKWLLSLILDEELKNAANSLFYLCGPFEFMQMCTITLLNRVGREQIRKEDFSTHPRLVAPQPPDPGKYNVEVALLGKRYNFSVQFPYPITKAAKWEGISLPYSCEAGRCGSCIATVTKGKFWMAYNEVLTDQEIENGRVLACQAYPQHGDGAVTFD
jgi:ring-1,2-phenylacetyl-CoA epoxidase subunit PaaE